MKSDIDTIACIRCLLITAMEETITGIVRVGRHYVDARYLTDEEYVKHLQDAVDWCDRRLAEQPEVTV